MEKMQYSIHINATKKKVWNTMLNDETYRAWTSVFNPSGSYYEGSWDTGSDILFLGPETDGTVSGMVSKIKESRPFDFVSIQHLGEIIKGEKKLWFGEGTPNTEMYENYTFVEKDGGTDVLVELVSTTPFPQEYADMFNGMWPKALEKLKSIAE